jgi:hypothetical protein
MLIAGIIGSLALLCLIIGAPWTMAEQIGKRYTPRASLGSSMLGAFVSGALMGVFVGFIPASIAYAVTHSGSAAGMALAICALVGGYLWWRFERRMRVQARQPAKPYFRKLAQTPARISEPPAI